MKASGILALSLSAAVALISIAGCSSGGELSETSVRPSMSTEPIESSHPAILPSWMGDPVVETHYGKVRGLPDESDTWVWKAIPYAKPPIGELRWKAPRDPQPWDGIREANDFCSMCTQYDPITGESVLGDEDCLYLNIWRPQSAERDLPVYVWIHGGGNAAGSATFIPTYYGSDLASKSNMVFVSMNYRLGPFGWFTHPALRTGNELDDSGNYGTLDIIKALQWVRDNIQAFGGDPGKVIVAGHSSGGTDVFSLMLSPIAKGLFHSALVQSCMIDSTPIGEGEASAQEVLLQLLVNDGVAVDRIEAETFAESMSNDEIRTYLRSKTREEILACYQQRGFGEVHFPEIFEDGYVIIGEGIGAFDTGTYPNKVPFIVGSTKEELKMFLYMDPAFEGKEDLYRAVTSYGSYLWKAWGVDGLVRRMRAHDDQPPIYVYHFLWGAMSESGHRVIPEPWDLKLGSFHMLDVPFFLGRDTVNPLMTRLVFTEENRPGREALSDAMMTYVANLARTGDPNDPPSGLPEWKAWSNREGDPKCILFDADLNDAVIKMSAEELTVPQVLERMRTSVEESVYSEAMEFLSSYRITSGLIDGNH